MKTKTINEDVSRCTAKAIGLSIEAKAIDGADDAKRLQEDIDLYLNNYAYVTGNKCPKCDAKLSGLLGTFRWGIVHGEGNCACGWPCRAYHRPKDRDGKEIFDGVWQIILPYHPSVVSKRQEG